MNDRNWIPVSERLPEDGQNIIACFAFGSVFAQLRRYTEAVIAAAESAADFAGFLRTNSPAADVDEVEAFAEMPPCDCNQSEVYELMDRINVILDVPQESGGGDGD